MAAATARDPRPTGCRPKSPPQVQAQRLATAQEGWVERMLEKRRRHESFAHFQAAPPGMWGSTTLARYHQRHLLLASAYPHPSTGAAATPPADTAAAAMPPAGTAAAAAAAIRWCPCHCCGGCRCPRAPHSPSHSQGMQQPLAKRARAAAAVAAAAAAEMCHWLCLPSQCCLRKRVHAERQLPCHWPRPRWPHHCHLLQLEDSRRRPQLRPPPRHQRPLQALPLASSLPPPSCAAAASLQTGRLPAPLPGQL